MADDGGGGGEGVIKIALPHFPNVKKMVENAI